MANTIRLKRGTSEPAAGNLVTGELAIDTSNGTVYSKLDDGSVTPIVGKAKNQTSVVRNETGSTIGAFKAVYISGAASNKALVTLAQANSEATSSKTFGVTVAAIASNANGDVVCTGLLDKVDTSSYTAGQALWLSPSSAGDFTTTMPTAPNHAVFIGIVTRAHATQGAVEIKIQNGYELGELHNLSISSLADKDIIAYNSATGLYENRTASALGLAPLASPTFTGTVTIPAGASISGFAPLASPTFTGTPTLPTGTTATTQATSDSSTKLATTAFVKNQAYATLASPTFTGTPLAPTPTTSDNSTKVATTAFVKNQSYAPIASPTFTGMPQAPTASYNSDTTLIATTAFVARAKRRPVNNFFGDLNTYDILDTNFVYQASGNSAGHYIYLYVTGYYNQEGDVIMFRQNDDYQINFEVSGCSTTFAGYYYASCPGAVIFAVKRASNDWFIFGDLTDTVYPDPGTALGSPTLDTTNLTASGIYDYMTNPVMAYTSYQTVATGWGGSTVAPYNQPYGTVMSGNYQYSAVPTDYYQLQADGSGGYFEVYVYSTGPDPYGTKYGTPFWDSGTSSVLQNVADGSGGNVNIAWDGYAPWPGYGTRLYATSYTNYGQKYDAKSNGYYLYYDEDVFADGSGGSYSNWSISTGYYYPYGWAFDGDHVDYTLNDYGTTYYDNGYNPVNPYLYGYTMADGMGNSSLQPVTALYGTQLSSWFYEYYSSNYCYIAADGSNGYYLQT